MCVVTSFCMIILQIKIDPKKHSFYQFSALFLFVLGHRVVWVTMRAPLSEAEASAVKKQWKEGQHWQHS